MRILPVVLTIVFCAPPPLAAWGRKGHEIVATLACRDLPPEVAPWFQGEEEVMRDHCNDPDEWKRDDPKEGARHFLDSEAYGGPASVPRDIRAAMAQVGSTDFPKDGQVLWVIQDRVHGLVTAFKSGDATEVVFQAAILCHYVGDLNVPLHTTGDYDGQASGQVGVHSRWETGLVKRLGSWDPGLRTASLDPQALFAPWQWLRESNALVAPLLKDDLEAREPGPAEPQWQALVSNYWQEFTRSQGPCVKEQLARAGQRTAQMILLAWTLAGKPEFGSIPAERLGTLLNRHEASRDQTVMAASNARAPIGFARVR